MMGLLRTSRAGGPMPAVQIKTPRLLLRPAVAPDWQQWAEVRGRNRAYLAPFEPSWPEDCLTRDFFNRRLARQARDWRQDRGYAFLMFHPGPPLRLIGGVNINNVSRGAAQYATLGYWLDEASQGRGYMTEALTGVIDYGFLTLKLHRFNAGCLRDNDRSVRLLRRLGFAEEGFAAKYIQINGAWQDHRLFGLPSEDWKKPDLAR